jgi:hypothetical protein
VNRVVSVAFAVDVDLYRMGIIMRLGCAQSGEGGGALAPIFGVVEDLDPVIAIAEVMQRHKG